MTGRGGRGGAGGYGTGSPIHFACPIERRERNDRRSRYGASPMRRHLVALTGATKPYRRTGTLGARSTDTSREWECSCGASGWSNHVDLERKARREATS